jgi:hypothetical protein
MRAMLFSILAVISGEALAPESVLSLKPFQRAGLWLAVMIMAPPAFWVMIPKLTVGVGLAWGARYTLISLALATSAAAAAKSSEAKRVS